jgi:Skp family chaperone for outer membrane proteins
LRRSISLTALIIAIFSTLPATAGEFRFLDAERAAVTVQEGVSQLKALETWANAQKATLELLQNDVIRRDQELTAQRGTVATEGLEQLERELRETQRELEDGARTFNREVAAKRRKLLGDIGDKIGQVASEYAEANGIDVVFLLGSQPMAYYSKKLDITDTVIRLYDARFPPA